MLTKTTILGRLLWNTLALLSLLCFWCSPVYSAPKALLIGLSEYAHPSAFSPGISDLNLPGVENDIITMKEVAHHLGFHSDNIISLINETATEQNIKRTITQELIRGVKTDDRVLIYFSGHGSAVWDEDGDEEDQKDEVLLAYDAHFVKKFGQYQLTGRLIDDEMSELLAQIPSDRVLFVVDACHSGNINKRFTVDTMKRFRLKYAANPYLKRNPNYPTDNTTSKRSKRFTPPLANNTVNESSNLLSTIAQMIGITSPPPPVKGRIFFSATNETGKSVLMSRGSLFTNSLKKTLLMEQAFEDATRKIDLQIWKNSIGEDLKKSHPQFDSEPQLFGDQLLIDSGY